MKIKLYWPTINFDSFYKGDLSSFNKILLENTEYNLLSNEEYIKNKRDIDNGLETFFKVNGL
ncbi:hypothetical protein CN437_21935 [Bacillus cereus]|nr:hypothetical protein CN437_21935 [Bacillus cereus]